MRCRKGTYRIYVRAIGLQLDMPVLTSLLQ